MCSAHRIVDEVLTCFFSLSRTQMLVFTIPRMAIKMLFDYKACILFVIFFVLSRRRCLFLLPFLSERESTTRRGKGQIRIH